MKRLLASLAAAAALIAPATAGAATNDPNAGGIPNVGTIWRSNSFQSPSGNIKCHYWAYDDVLTCTTLNTGLTIYLTRYLPAGHRYSYLAEGHGPTLQYGQRWVVGGFRCDSYFTGMNCRSSAGHGFTLNRTDYNVW